MRGVEKGKGRWGLDFLCGLIDCVDLVCICDRRSPKIVLPTQFTCVESHSSYLSKSIVFYFFFTFSFC